MKRILITGMQHDYNGIEAFIMNVYRNIDRNEYQFDFLTTHDAIIACEDEIQSLGGHIYKVEVPMKENFFKHFFAIKRFFKENGKKYYAIHMNSCFPNYSLPLKYAKKYGVNVRIFHSHNSSDMYVSDSKTKELVKRIKYNYERYMIHKRATHLLACSDEAGKYMFNKNKFTVIKNGIVLGKFKYDAEIRRKKRQELKIKDNTKVIGFVGRLQYQKNPMFLLKILHELVKFDKDYMLLVIGVGDKEQEMRDYINKNQLDSNVTFLGRRSDVNDLYSAMDVFVLPSIFEGLGIVLIEAQASGLKCVTSDNVPILTRVTENITYHNIDNIDSWIEDIKKYQLDLNCRENAYRKVEKERIRYKKYC
ncbi:MAG: glycosyltransferase [Clostridia bacterium]|nr:glycosyltransferase [Clostridia bacterium]